MAINGWERSLRKRWSRFITGRVSHSYCPILCRPERWAAYNLFWQRAVNHSNSRHLWNTLLQRKQCTLALCFFLLPDDKVRDVQVMFQVWCVQLCPSQFVIYVPQGKVSHALNACWRASVGAHHTAASKVCIHILLQIKKLVYVKKKRKKNNDSH